MTICHAEIQKSYFLPMLTLTKMNEYNTKRWNMWPVIIGAGSVELLL